MAIYSLNVTSVGKSTHAPGTAGAHLSYIAREGAATHCEAVHMPADETAARTWMDGYEREARANARLLTKVRVALPRELDHAQNVVLARDFVATLTGGRIPSYLAIHDDGADATNPHAHIVLIDRDCETGKRVLLLTDSRKDRLAAGLPENGVSMVREKWETIVNRHLAQAGHDARIDRRSLEAQGIDRTPQLHIGPRAQHIDAMVQKPESKVRPAPTPRNPDRTIDYPGIDAGRTRKERNAEIIDFNLEKNMRSPHFETRLWARFEKAQRLKEKPLQAALVLQARRRTTQERLARAVHAKVLREIRSRRSAEARFVGHWLREQHQPLIDQLKTRHHAERAALAENQSRLLSRLFEIADVTGRIRKKRNADRAALDQKQRTDRRDLKAGIALERQTQRDAVKVRCVSELDEAKARIAAARSELREKHKDERKQEDAMLQAKAREREQDRRAVQMQIEILKKQAVTIQAECLHAPRLER